MPDTITGSCLCNAVTFEIENQFDNLFFCHCSQCRKATGSAHASNLFGDPAKFHWITGAENIQIFKLPGRGFSTSFCTICGARVPFKSSRSNKMIIPAGSLDAEPDFAKIAKIFCAEQAHWHQAGNQARTFDGFPK